MVGAIPPNDGFIDPRIDSFEHHKDTRDELSRTRKKLDVRGRTDNWRERSWEKTVVIVVDSFDP